jgi:signal transduction histidine kinase
VVQIEINTNEWVYIAALLPTPYVTLDESIFDREQIISLFFSTTILLVLTFSLMRRQVRPLRNLAKAANEMSMDVNQKPLKEEGADEIVMATRAFNKMQQRIRRYVADREHLFSSISHDLKTPITRLRLRTELLVSEVKRDKFSRDLDDLEMMVKGALQCVRDTDLHENNTEIDINQLIAMIAEDYNWQQQKVFVTPIDLPPITARPLAMKRVFTNLIENGVKYGKEVNIMFDKNKDWLTVTISDDGPGIPVDYLENVFEPYFRLASDSDGHGLGLGICRNILHGHGGDIELRNAAAGGLKVKVFIPLSYEV